LLLHQRVAQHTLLAQEPRLLRAGLTLLDQVLQALEAALVGVLQPSAALGQGGASESLLLVHEVYLKRRRMIIIMITALKKRGGGII
jgi:hypothetical protein